MDNIENWMKDNGIEDVTGDKEKEMEAAIHMDIFYTVDNDRKAMQFFFKILKVMQREEKLSEYAQLECGKLMHYLEKYLFNKGQ